MATTLLVELPRGVHAIPMERVVEVVAASPITPVPGAPEPIRGLFALRGHITPVVNLPDADQQDIPVHPGDPLVLVQVPSRHGGALTAALPVLRVVGFGEPSDAPELSLVSTLQTLETQILSSRLSGMPS